MEHNKSLVFLKLKPKNHKMQQSKFTTLCDAKQAAAGGSLLKGPLCNYVI